MYDYSYLAFLLYFEEYFNKNYDNSLIFLAASRNLKPKFE